MAIASLPMGIPPNLFYYRETISTTTERWVLTDQLDAAGWDGVQRVDAKIIVNSNVLVGSNSTASAMNFESLPNGSRVVLESFGRIFGIGGNGGRGGDAHEVSGNNISTNSADSGTSGGRAMWVRTPLIFRNFGKVHGGGGGGGGGGACGIKTQDADVYGYAGGGGGGGQGYRPSNNRGGRGNNTTQFQTIPPAGSSRAENGQNGTVSSPGDGGHRGYRINHQSSFHSGHGGDGGGPGKSGKTGTSGESSNTGFLTVDKTERDGGFGGNPGEAINGASWITFEATGEIKGEQVN